MGRQLLLVGTACLLLSGFATAQTTGQRITIEPQASSTQSRQEGLVRVQVSVSMFMPGPTGDSEEAIRVRDRARRMMYEMAGKECDLLREVIARDCRLESITSNLNRQSGQHLEGYTVGGSMSLQITLK
jgi:hypothetical protein